MPPSTTELLYRALGMVIAERDRQQDIHGETNKDNTILEWQGILAEEYGEFAMEALKDHFSRKYGKERDRTNLLAEVVQTAAVAVAIAEYLIADADRERFSKMTGGHPADIPVEPETVALADLSPRQLMERGLPVCGGSRPHVPSGCITCQAVVNDAYGWC